MRIAIVLRGQAFRAGDRFAAGCNNAARDHQLEQAGNFSMNVVRPLVALGVSVDLFVHENSQGCALVQKDLIPAYRASGAPVVAADINTVGASQREEVDIALKNFETHAHGKPYDAILLGRHDLTWKAPITEFADVGDFAKSVYFLSVCDPGKRNGGDDCRHDCLQVFPGSLYGTIREKVIGQDGCFGDSAHQNGHMCKVVMDTVLDPPIPTKVLTDFVPHGTVRDPRNDLASINLVRPGRRRPSHLEVIWGQTPKSS
jgi:hypothetical protein